MHFILWTKGSHENINFDIFKCFDENLLNSSRYYLNHKFFFKFCMILQFHEIYLYSLVLFSVKCCILCTKGTNQSANILDFLVLRSKFTKFLSFLKQKSFSSNFAPLSQCALGYQPPSKTPPPLSCQVPLKSTNCPSPPF